MVDARLPQYVDELAQPRVDAVGSPVRTGAALETRLRREAAAVEELPGHRHFPAEH
jgi:hypothetical protein